MAYRTAARQSQKTFRRFSSPMYSQSDILELDQLFVSDSYVDKKTPLYRTVEIFSQITGRKIWLKPGDKPSTDGSEIQLPMKDSYAYRRLEHQISHILFKSDSVAKDAFAKVYSDRISKIAKKTGATIKADALGYVISTVISLLEDHRVKSLWGLIYEGSSNEMDDIDARDIENLLDFVDENFFVFMSAVSFGMDVKSKKFGKYKGLVKESLGKVEKRGFDATMISAKWLIVKMVDRLIAEAMKRQRRQEELQAAADADPDAFKEQCQQQQGDSPPDEDALDITVPGGADPGDGKGEGQEDEGEDDRPPEEGEGSSGEGNDSEDGDEDSDESEGGSGEDDSESSDGESEDENGGGGSSSSSGEDGEGGGSGGSGEGKDEEKNEDSEGGGGDSKDDEFGDLTDEEKKEFDDKLKDPKTRADYLGSLVDDLFGSGDISDDEKKYEEQIKEEYKNPKYGNDLKKKVAENQVNRALNVDVNDQDKLQENLDYSQKEMEKIANKAKDSIGGNRTEEEMLRKDAMARITFIDVKQDKNAEKYVTTPEEKTNIERLRAIFNRIIGKRKLELVESGSEVDVQAFISRKVTWSPDPVFKSYESGRGFRAMVVLDRSGSMSSYGKTEQSEMACRIIKRAFRYPFVDFDVWGFSSPDAGEVQLFRYEKEIDVFTSNASKIGGTTPLHVAIRVAGRHLMLSGTDSKHMFVVSDGFPVYRSMYGTLSTAQLMRFVRTEVRKIRNRGISLTGVMILNSSDLSGIGGPRGMQFMFGERRFWKVINPSRVGRDLVQLVSGSLVQYLKSR